MEQAITRFLETIFFLPGIYLLLIGATWAVARKSPRHTSWALAALATIVYVTSARVVSDPIIAALENTPALTQAQLLRPQAGAIVVLASGYYHPAPEYPATTTDTSNLVRLRYGAFVHRMTKLPVLVSGGQPSSRIDVPLAKVMETVLRDEFGVAEIWLEDKSKTTWENALFSAIELKQRGVETAYLVTHAWHMPRSIAAFERAGVKVIAAPTHFTSTDYNYWHDRWLPSNEGIAHTNIILHELIGRLWYTIRH